MNTRLRKSIGATMLIVVFAALFWITTLKSGWTGAALIWLATITVTAMIVAAVFLLCE